MKSSGGHPVLAGNDDYCSRSLLVVSLASTRHLESITPPSNQTDTRQQRSTSIRCGIFTDHYQAISTLCRFFNQMILKRRHGQQNQVSIDRSACVERVPHRRLDLYLFSVCIDRERSERRRSQMGGTRADDGRAGAWRMGNDRLDCDHRDDQANIPAQEKREASRHRLAGATVLLYGRVDIYPGDRGENVRSAGMLDE